MRRTIADVVPFPRERVRRVRRPQVGVLVTAALLTGVLGSSPAAAKDPLPPGSTTPSQSSSSSSSDVYTTPWTPADLEMSASTPAPSSSIPGCLFWMETDAGARKETFSFAITETASAVAGIGRESGHVDPTCPKAAIIRVHAEVAHVCTNNTYTAQDTQEMRDTWGPVRATATQTVSAARWTDWCAWGTTLKFRWWAWGVWAGPVHHCGADCGRFLERCAEAPYGGEIREVPCS